MGGYSDHEAHFAFLYRLPASNSSYSFSALKIRFLQPAKRNLTHYQALNAIIEVTKYTDSETDPGNVAEIITGYFLFLFF
mgnify:CR=1 FL=1